MLKSNVYWQKCTDRNLFPAASHHPPFPDKKLLLFLQTLMSVAETKSPKVIICTSFMIFYEQQQYDADNNLCNAWSLSPGRNCPSSFSPG